MNTTQDDGGAAFPGLHPNMECRFADSGMSLRDYFAAEAMASINSAPHNRFPDIKDETQTAVAAYQIADAMLAARKEAK